MQDTRRKANKSGNTSPSETEPNDDLKSPSAAPPAPVDDRIEAMIASNAEKFSSITFAGFFRQWYDGSTTDLQKDQVEADLTNKTVIWSGKISDIKSGHEGGIRVIVSPTDGTYGTAFLDFDASQKNDFLELKEGNTIRFTGVIRSFIASPFIKECKLIRVIK